MFPCTPTSIELGSDGALGELLPAAARSDWADTFESGPSLCWGAIVGGVHGFGAFQALDGRTGPLFRAHYRRHERHFEFPNDGHWNSLPHELAAVAARGVLPLGLVNR